MKIGFCAIWKNKLSEYHANKNDEIDTTLKINECFHKANDLGIKIHGLHNIRWSSDNQYFTYWECPNFEVLEIIISDLEKAGDFKFAKSKHFIGNELYSFSSGRKDVLKTNLSLGSILFIGLKKNLANSKPQIFCEVLEKLLKDNKLISNYCYNLKPFSLWDYFIYIQTNIFENFDGFIENLEGIKLEIGFNYKIYTGVKESIFRFGRSYQMKNEWAKKQ